MTGVQTCALPICTRRTAADLLRYPSIDLSDLARVWPDLNDFGADVTEQLAIDAVYAGYLDRQQADIVAFRKDESLALPDGLDYAAISGLSNEMVEKLKAARPATLGQAGRIPGVTPAALTLLLAHVRRGVGVSRAPGI